MLETVPTAIHRDDDRLPYVTVDQGIELKVLQIKVREGLWVIRNRFAPGARVQTHTHTGTVFAFTTRGAWRYRESDFINTPGSYLYEPAGSVHTTPVISFMRTATRATTLAGAPIAAGEPVLMLYASANRDEAVFGETAARLDVARDPNPHLACGVGQHFCLGAALARLEGRMLLDALLARFTAIAPAGAIVRTSSPVIAGIRTTPIVLH